VAGGRPPLPLAYLAAFDVVFSGHVDSPALRAGVALNLAVSRPCPPGLMHVMAAIGACGLVAVIAHRSFWPR